MQSFCVVIMRHCGVKQSIVWLGVRCEAFAISSNLFLSHRISPAPPPTYRDSSITYLFALHYSTQCEPRVEANKCHVLLLLSFIAGCRLWVSIVNGDDVTLVGYSNDVHMHAECAKCTRLKHTKTHSHLVKEPMRTHLTLEIGWVGKIWCGHTDMCRLCGMRTAAVVWVSALHRALHKCTYYSKSSAMSAQKAKRRTQSTHTIDDRNCNVQRRCVWRWATAQDSATSIDGTRSRPRWRDSTVKQIICKVYVYSCGHRIECETLFILPQRTKSLQSTKFRMCRNKQNA